MKSIREKYAEHRRSILECIEYYEGSGEPLGVQHCKKTLADSDRIQTRETKQRIKSELIILLDLHGRERVCQIVEEAINELTIAEVMES